MDWLLDPIKELFVQGGIALWNCYFALVGSTGNTDILTGEFSTLFGNDTVWNMIKAVHQTAIIPIGESILALFMLVQLVKISQRIDATSTLPAVKDIVFLIVIYFILHWLITNSLAIVDAVYDVFNNISSSIASGAAISVGNDLNINNWDSASATVGGCLLFLIMGLFALPIGAVAYIVALIVGFARALQLYVMAAFSPVPLSLLGFDETRQMGVGYLKNFCAVALAGAIILLLLAAYPYIAASLGGVPDNNGSIFNITYETNIGSGIISILKFFAVSIMLIVGLVKSGAWARDILGG